QAGFKEFIYIDGFAGPGRYLGGEDGSPIIALKAAIEQQDRISSKVFFRFIEKEKDRAEYLKELIEGMAVPDKYHVRVIADEFEPALDKFMAGWRSTGRKPAPTFAFIDPFGWKVPFRLVIDLMQNSSCEVLINFMYGEINR